MSGSQPPQGPARDHFRGKARPGRRVNVSYVTHDGNTVDAYTRDLGVGGAFIVTDEPLPAQSSCKLTLAIPGDPLTVKAEIRWVAREANEDEEVGMGVKFYGLEVEELMRLNEYFSSLTGAE